MQLFFILLHYTCEEYNFYQTSHDSTKKGIMQFFLWIIIKLSFLSQASFLQGKPS